MKIPVTPFKHAPSDFIGSAHKVGYAERLERLQPTLITHKLSPIIVATLAVRTFPKETTGVDSGTTCTPSGNSRRIRLAM
jgi:hypothetical protein